MRIVASLSLAFFCVLGSPQAMAQVGDRDAGWRSDLEFLVEEAQRVHADPAQPAFSSAFDLAAGDLHSEIPDLSDDQVAARMMRLVAMLNDGHSAIYGPSRDTPLLFERRVLPFKFYAFPKGIYVVGGIGAYAEYVGFRVISIGDLAVEEVLARMSKYRGVDNEMTFRWMGPQFYLRRLFMLREVGAAGPGGSVELTLVRDEEAELVVTAECGEYELVRKLRPFPGEDSDVPLYLQNVDRNYWLKSLPEDGSVYVQFNQVRNAAQESIGDFSERLRAAFFGNDFRKLIVDVRHNNGGNNSLVRPLVRALIEFEMRSPNNQLFVIVGRNTFSAAQNFINHIERWTNAIFVGEPSSSSPNFVGEENEILLPFSRLRGSISNRYWQDSNPGDLRQWIAMDIPIELTFRDYEVGIDRALEKILALTEEQDED